MQSNQPLTHESALQLCLWGNKTIELSEPILKFLKKNFSISGNIVDLHNEAIFKGNVTVEK